MLLTLLAACAWSEPEPPPPAVAPVAPAPAPVERPCERGYVANTRLEVAEQVAVVDRFFPDGRRDAVRVPFADVVRVEHRVDLRPSGERCSSVYLVLADREVLFEDAEDADLAERARTLAWWLERPLVEAAPPSPQP